MKRAPFRGFPWLVLLFATALAGATWLNFSLVGQVRRSLERGVLGVLPATAPLRYHLALIVPDSPDAFFDGLIRGVLHAASTAETAVQLFRYRDTSPTGAAEPVGIALTSRLDGVIVWAAVGAPVERWRDQARRAGVAFVPVGTQRPQLKGMTFIGSSRLLQGIEAGDQATRTLGKAARVGLILPYDSWEDALHDPVYQGVKVALRSFAGADIVAAIRAKPGILSGEEAASNLLRSQSSINVLICANAPITEGAGQVLIDQGLVGRIEIVGTDESPTIDRWVDRGVILASIVRDSEQMGERAVKAFADDRKGMPWNRVEEVGFNVRTRKDRTP